MGSMGGGWGQLYKLSKEKPEARTEERGKPVLAGSRSELLPQFVLYYYDKTANPNSVLTQARALCL
jgi:hypothetical protein